jgi:hypothetical protein
MTIPAFDTLRIAQALRDAGFDNGQAEAIVAAIQQSLGENVATKSDLMELRTLMEAGFAEMRTELRGEFRAEMGAMEARLVRWFAGLLIMTALGTVTATVALVKLLE